MIRPATLITAAAVLIGGCAHEPQTDFEAAPVAVTCPAAELPEGARCLRGTDSAGAPYLIAMPRRWNGVLVLHAHGGPTFGAPTSKRTDADLKRWAVVVRAGYAWAASAFHDSGVAVRSAAEDTERLRRIFVHDVARPKVTILHGQSWGASVAEKAAELYASGSGPSSYDGVLLTSGVLAGATRAYDFRLDLRVVYQYLCGNHPRPDEPQYPLWMGLPRDAALTRTELAARVDRCLGVRRKPAERTAEQERKLRTIADVVRIPQRSVLSHLEWATWGFRDIVQNRTHGLNPFGNVGVRYAGSDDDDALNAGVLRYRADARAVALLAADADLTGRIAVPVLTVHAIDDPTAFVEMDAAFRRTMIDSGTADHLVQTFTDDHEHSYLSDPDYPALLAALLDWVQHGHKPTPAGVAQRCMVLEAEFGPGCRFLPDYHPKPLDMRVAIEARR